MLHHALRLFILACSLLLVANHGLTQTKAIKETAMPAYETEEFIWRLVTSHYYLDSGATQIVTIERQNWMKDALGKVVAQWWGAGNVWGLGGTPMGGDKRRARLPKTLRTTYYDYQEDRFYQLDAELPLQKLHALFKETVVSPSLNYGKVVPKFDTFKIGIAPQGHVVVWVGGRGGDDQIELGIYKAQMMRDMTVAGYNATKPAFPLKADRWTKLSYSTSLKPETVAKLKTGWMPELGYYLKQRTKYPWRYRMSGNAHLLEIMEGQGNQEHFYVGPWMMGLYKGVAAMRGIPSAATLWFNDLQGKRHSIWLGFYSKERVAGEPDLGAVWNAFETVFPGRKPEDNDYLPGDNDMATVDIHVSDDLKTYTATLIKGQQRINIPIGDTQFFNLESYAHGPGQPTPKPEVVKLLQNGPEAARP
jgi:hypothetical protein